MHRALDLLDAVGGRSQPMALAEIADLAGLPLPTAHRLVATLVERGYLRRQSDRRYTLGFRLVPLGAAAGALAGSDAQDVLAGLVDALGESANLALLVGDRAEYVAQAPARYSMRMFTEVGRRVELHCTGVGKALLAGLEPDRVAGLLAGAGMPRHTPHTLTTHDALAAELERVRARGYALDEQEQEVGVRCVAVAVGGTGLAVSVSGPTTRMDEAAVARAVPLLRDAATALEARGGPPVTTPRPVAGAARETAHPADPQEDR